MCFCFCVLFFVCVCVRRGVSMFAMLTGTLPFTVEPFNIKQLHQKMVNGEISSIPSDISKGSSTFHLTKWLLHQNEDCASGVFEF